MAKRLPVRVLNPDPHGRCYTTYRAALRFVQAGIAAWDSSGISIRFHHRLERTEAKRYDATARGYDDVRRVMSLDEIAGLPCARPQMALWGRDMRAL